MYIEFCLFLFYIFLFFFFLTSSHTSIQFCDKDSLLGEINRILTGNVISNNLWDPPFPFHVHTVNMLRSGKLWSVGIISKYLKLTCKHHKLFHLRCGTKASFSGRFRSHLVTQLDKSSQVAYCHREVTESRLSHKTSMSLMIISGQLDQIIIYRQIIQSLSDNKHTHKHTLFSPVVSSEPLC